MDWRTKTLCGHKQLFAVNTSMWTRLATCHRQGISLGPMNLCDIVINPHTQAVMFDNMDKMSALTGREAMYQDMLYCAINTLQLLLPGHFNAAELESMRWRISTFCTSPLTDEDWKTCRANLEDPLVLEVLGKSLSGECSADELRKLWELVEGSAGVRAITVSDVCDDDDGSESGVTEGVKEKECCAQFLNNNEQTARKEVWGDASGQVSGGTDSDVKERKNGVPLLIHGEEAGSEEVCDDVAAGGESGAVEKESCAQLLNHEGQTDSQDQEGLGASNCTPGSDSCQSNSGQASSSETQDMPRTSSGEGLPPWPSSEPEWSPWREPPGRFSTDPGTHPRPDYTEHVTKRKSGGNTPASSEDEDEC